MLCCHPSSLRSIIHHHSSRGRSSFRPQDMFKLLVSAPKHIATRSSLLRGNVAGFRSLSSDTSALSPEAVKASINKLSQDSPLSSPLFAWSEVGRIVYVFKNYVPKLARLQLWFVPSFVRTILGWRKKCDNQDVRVHRFQSSMVIHDSDSTFSGKDGPSPWYVADI